MSTQLEQQGIELTEGYDPSQLDPAPESGGDWQRHEPRQPLC